jgi:hypothetical protein
MKVILKFVIAGYLYLCITSLSKPSQSTDQQSKMTFQHQIIWLINNELERILKEVVMARFKILSQHMPGGPEEYHEQLQAE